MLLATMDVFIQEPLIDWLKNAKNAKMDGSKEVPASDGSAPISNSAAGAGSTGAPAATAWYPARKVNIAQRKLNLAHPSLLTCDELATGKLADKHPFIDRVMDIVRGDPADSLRCVLCLSVPLFCLFVCLPVCYHHCWVDYW